MRLETTAIRLAFKDTRRSVVLQVIQNLERALADVSNVSILLLLWQIIHFQFLQLVMQMNVPLHMSYKLT